MRINLKELFHERHETMKGLGEYKTASLHAAVVIIAATLALTGESHLLPELMKQYDEVSKTIRKEINHTIGFNKQEEEAS